MKSAKSGSGNQPVRSSREHAPTQQSRKQVEAMAGYGVPEADIGQVLSIDPKTLRKHYRTELDRGHIIANTKVAENLFKIATGTGREAVTAAIFWLKTRAGWSEYAPPPAPKSPEPLGKKDQADLAAKTAEQGTGWGSLLRH